MNVNKQYFGLELQKETSLPTFRMELYHKAPSKEGGPRFSILLKKVLQQ